MASLGNQYSPTKSLSITAIIVSLLFSMSPSAVSITEDCGITIYWGQDGGEGELTDVCNTPYYKYVNVAFLYKFGGFQTPEINLAGHCGPWSPGSCLKYSDQIKYCQSKGIKVLLSIGGGTPETYDLISPEDANFLGEYIWNYFLGGTPSPGTSRPLGDAVFDGVDFDIEKPPPALYYDDLARKLASYSTNTQKVYLSAAPQCVYPDAALDVTIKTGLMNYIWVQFYNNPSCDYSGGSTSLKNAWNKWSSSIPTGSLLFLGLPATPAAASAGTGYIPPENLKSEILPVIRTSSNYGGVMLWSRRFDNPPIYSAAIYPDVCPASGYGTTLINNVVDVISAV